jgi:hypothetical protein
MHLIGVPSMTHDQLKTYHSARLDSLCPGHPEIEIEGAPGHVIYHFVARSVVCSGQILSGHGESNGISNTLAERTRCDLYAFNLDFGMTGAERPRSGK